MRAQLTDLNRNDWVQLFRDAEPRLMPSLSERSMQMPQDLDVSTVIKSFSILTNHLSAARRATEINDQTVQYLQASETSRLKLRQEILVAPNRTLDTLRNAADAMAAAYRIACKSINAVGKAAREGDGPSIIVSSLLDVALADEHSFARYPAPMPPDFTTEIRAHLEQLMKRQDSIEEAIRSHTPMVR